MAEVAVAGEGVLVVEVVAEALAAVQHGVLLAAAAVVGEGAVAGQTGVVALDQLAETVGVHGVAVLTHTLLVGEHDVGSFA